MFEDLNGDKVINEGANTVDDPGDRKIIGNSTPRFRFGLDLGVEWKGIDFSMFWQGVAKRDLWLDGLMFWGISGGEWQSTGLKKSIWIIIAQKIQLLYLVPIPMLIFPKCI